MCLACLFQAAVTDDIRLAAEFSTPCSKCTYRWRLVDSDINLDKVSVGTDRQRLFIRKNKLEYSTVYVTELTGTIILNLGRFYVLRGRIVLLILRGGGNIHPIPPFRE